MEYGLVAVWLGLFLALGALALPASSLLFASLPDDGAGLSVAVAFGLLAFTGFWMGQVSFGPAMAFLAIALLVVASLGALRSGVELQWDRYGEAAVVFALAFFLLVGIRAFDPGAYPGGGEKFLDFNLLASLLRATILPPEDVWFANEPVRYYYGGHMLAAMFAHVTDTAARYAYNLALAGYYAAFVATAWGLGGAISAGVGRSYRRGGAVAAFFVAIASNLSTPMRLVVWALPEWLGSPLADLSSLEMKGLATGPMNFNPWYASRVINAGPPGESSYNLISEFPFFAFLNGDLHGHMMSPVFLLLGVGIAYGYWRTSGENLRRRLGLTFLALPPVVGILLIVNTWSAPALVGMAWLSLLFAPATPWSLLPARLGDVFDRWASRGLVQREITRLLVATGMTAVIAVLGALTVAPFLLGTASGRSIGLLPDSTSRLGGLLLVHGGFLAITVTYLLRDATARRAVVAGAIGVLAIGVTALLGVPAVGLFVPILVGAWALLRTDAEVDFETVLVVGALGLLVLVEFVYVVEAAAPGRFNTVFKVYAQVWALWSVAAGAMVAHLPPVRPVIDRLRRRARRLVARNGTPSDPDRSGGSRRDSDTGATRKGTLATLLFALLVASTAIYAGFGTATAVGNGPPATLDARAFVETDHPKEAAAIAWVDDRRGQPTLVSAPGEDVYTWMNAPSSLTGVPTVAGWSHETGYRGEEAYRSRVRDVDAIFETGDRLTRAALLKRYGVEYVYVGPIERERYDVRSYDREPGITVAYEDEWVTIYRVNESGLVE